MKLSFSLFKEIQEGICTRRSRTNEARAKAVDLLRVAGVGTFGPSGIPHCFFAHR